MVGSENTFIQFRGDGHTTVFEWPYDFVDADSLKVLYADADGVLRNVTASTTVNGNKIKYPRSGDPIPDGSLLIVYRETDVVQTLDLPDKYPYDNIEKALDHIVYILQEHAREIGKSLRLSFGSSEKEFVLDNGQVDFIKNYDQYRKELQALLDDTRSEHSAVESARKVTESNRELAVNAMQVASEQAGIASTKASDSERLYNQINAKLADADARVAVAQGVESTVTELANQVSNNTAKTTQMADTATSASNKAVDSANKAIDALGTINSIGETVKAKATEVATNTQTAKEQASLAKQYADKAQGVAGGDFATHAEVDAIKADVGNMKEQVGVDLTERLNSKANKSDLTNYYTKGDSDNLYFKKADINNYYNRGEVDAKVSSIDTSVIIPKDLGQGNTPTDAGGKIVFKAVNSSEAPDNGYVMEFGYNTAYKSQLFIGDKPSAGLHIGGWQGNGKEDWQKLATEGFVNNSIGGVMDNINNVINPLASEVNNLKSSALTGELQLQDSHGVVSKFSNGLMIYENLLEGLYSGSGHSSYTVDHMFPQPFASTPFAMVTVADKFTDPFSCVAKNTNTVKCTIEYARGITRLFILVIGRWK